MNKLNCIIYSNRKQLFKIAIFHNFTEKLFLRYWICVICIIVSCDIWYICSIWFLDIRYFHKCCVIVTGWVWRAGTEGKQRWQGRACEWIYSLHVTWVWRHHLFNESRLDSSVCLCLLLPLRCYEYRCFFVMKINELYLLAFSFFSWFFPPCFCLSSGSSRARREPRSSGSAGSTCEYNEISHSSHGCGVSVLAMSLPPAGCWWRARSQRSAGSVWAEGRRGLTGFPGPPGPVGLQVRTSAFGFCLFKTLYF